MSDRTVFINESDLTNIADAIRSKNNSADTYLPSEMAGAISSLQISNYTENAGGINIETMATLSSSEWVRPSDWPNIQSLSVDFANDEEVVYLLYGNDRGSELRWAGFSYSLLSANNITPKGMNVEIGTIQEGTFVPVSSFTYEISYTNNKSGNMGNYENVYVNYDGINSDYVVFKITPLNLHFIRFTFATIPTSAGVATEIFALNNYCLEKYGNLPYIRSLDAASADAKNTIRSYRNDAS